MVVTRLEWESTARTLVSSASAGRVSGATLTLFDRTTVEGGTVFRMTHTLTVSGNQMLGWTTEQFELYSDSLALTKQ